MSLGGRSSGRIGASTAAPSTTIFNAAGPLLGLSGDEGDGGVNLSFGLCSGRSSAASQTVIVNNHPDDEGGQVTTVARSSKSPAPIREASGNNGDPPRQQFRMPSVSRDASARPTWMQSPSPLSARLSSTASRRGRECGETDCGIDDVGDACDGREVWAEHRRALHPRREESITRGVQRLRVGERENDFDAPAVGVDDQEWNDDDGEGGEDDANHVPALKQSSMGGRGRKTRACARNGRRGKKAAGKGSDAEADGDVERGRQFCTAYARMKPREWKWLDVEQRLKKVGVDREAERCGKKWENLMQQVKKLHHFQGLSRKHNFFQFSGKERLSKGFNFNMDRAVYDEILGSTAKSHTINLKNVTDIGAPGGVRLPSATSVDPESVGDGDTAAGHDDDEDGSMRGSSQTTGSHAGFDKRKSTTQQTFEALTDCMEKHGALLASTMESNNKRQCSIQNRQCESLEAEVEVQKKHYVASDEVSKPMCHALLEIAKAIRELTRRAPPLSRIHAFRRDCCDIACDEGHSPSVVAILAFVAFITFVATFIAFLAILAAFIAFLAILVFVAFIAFLAILAAFIAFLTIVATFIAFLAILAPVTLRSRHVAAASVLGHVNFIAVLFDRGVRTSVSSSPTPSSPPSPRSQSIPPSPSSCSSPIRAIVQNVFRAVNGSDDIIATPVESDFEEEEEVPLTLKSARRGSGALRIDDVGERRGGGGRAMMEDVINVNAVTASGRGGGTTVGQQHRATLARANEAPELQEVVVRARTPATPGATTSTDIGVSVQAVGQGSKSRSPAQEQRGAAHVGEGAGAGGAAVGGAPHVAEGARAGRAATMGASQAAEGVRAGGAKAGGVPQAGEGARADNVATQGEDDEALVNRVRQRNVRDGIEASSKMWVDDICFWNETKGSALVKLMQEARMYLVVVARGVQPPALRRSIVLPHTTIPQHKINNESELNAAPERAMKVKTIALRVIHGWVFNSTSRQQVYHAAYSYALNHGATNIARAIWMGEDWRVCVSPMVFHITLDMDMMLPVWFVGANIEDRHENDELAAYQEASIQRLVGAFTSAISTTEGIDGGGLSHERLKSVAEAMRIMLAATMWLMRMSGDDHRSHYDAWVFVQLTTKPTLIASMHGSFDVRGHIMQAATTITDKFVKPPMTLVPPPLYIPDWASIGVKFSHDATLSSPMEAKKLDWLGTCPPEDEDDNEGDDEGGEGE
ncbi:hypothetical protein CBR_g26380 [Chara braunii]|uniref:Myb-like domain-containing protein n=1 Tax=Chara braunii TaxID=69332 RepID=A0A388L7Q0_CHABU|nr:hypothetical protein CBR_g26380 [Chara braunii]|eukprot:GBG78351.1 hypothetical protein CBR_g26380 [Chara braunii]